MLKEILIWRIYSDAHVWTSDIVPWSQETKIVSSIFILPCYVALLLIGSYAKNKSLSSCSKTEVNCIINEWLETF